MIILSWIYKLVSSLWNGQELLEQRKESTFVQFERGAKNRFYYLTRLTSFISYMQN